MKATDWHWIDPNHGERHLARFMLRVERAAYSEDVWHWLVYCLADTLGQNGLISMWCGQTDSSEAAVNRAETALVGICESVINEIDAGGHGCNPK